MKKIFLILFVVLLVPVILMAATKAKKEVVSNSGLIYLPALQNVGGEYIEGGSAKAAAFDINVLNATEIKEVKDNPVPEPATIFLLGLGLLGLASISRNKQNNP